MVIDCRTCGATIPAENINLNRVLAKCDRCNSVFDFSEQIDSSVSQEFMRPPVFAAPKGFSMVEANGILQIERRWMHPLVFFLIFFSLSWNFFLFFWYSIAFSSGEWTLLLFPLIHVVVGISLIYTTLAMLINRTTIMVDLGQLTIRHGPLPWFGNVQVNAADLAQLYVHERIRRSRHGSQVMYQLRARSRIKGDFELIGWMTAPEHAQYLEQEIERFLGIKNAPVLGELNHS